MLYRSVECEYEAIADQTVGISMVISCISLLLLKDPSYEILKYVVVTVVKLQKLLLLKENSSLQEPILKLLSFLSEN